MEQMKAAKKKNSLDELKANNFEIDPKSWPRWDKALFAQPSLKECL